MSTVIEYVTEPTDKDYGQEGTQACEMCGDPVGIVLVGDTDRPTFRSYLGIKSHLDAVPVVFCAACGSWLKDISFDLTASVEPVHFV